MLTPSIYFVAKDGTTTNLAPYSEFSPFPVSLATYPTVKLLINNLGDLTKEAVVVSVPPYPIFPCYAGTVSETPDTIVTAQSACPVGTVGYLKFAFGNTTDYFNYISTK